MPVNYKDYPKDWQQRSRFIRKHRAKWHCERCGVRNGSSTGKGWEVILTVAHLFDKDKKNGSFLNLVALCQKCHFDLDSTDRRKRTKLEHFPYPQMENKERWERKKKKAGLWFLHPSLPTKFHITRPVKFGERWHPDEEYYRKRRERLRSKQKH